MFPRGTEGSLMKTVLFLVTTIRFNDSTLIEFLIDLKTKIRLFCVCVCVYHYCSVSLVIDASLLTAPVHLQMRLVHCHVCLCGYVFCVCDCDWMSGNSMRPRISAVALLLRSFMLDVSLIHSFSNLSLCCWQKEQGGASSVVGWQDVMTSRWSLVLYHNNSTKGLSSISKTMLSVTIYIFFNISLHLLPAKSWWCKLCPNPEDPV